MAKYNKYSEVQNLFYLPVQEIRLSNLNKQSQLMPAISLNHGGSLDYNKNLNNSLAPVNKPRFIQTVALWRDAIRIAEYAVLPFRYLMQLQYMDTILDSHIRACIRTRERLQFQRLRKAVVSDADGNINKEWTAYFQKPWFRTLCKYILEAKWYGYTLISMGDIIDNNFPQIVMIPRTHISPDRLCVSMVPEATTGQPFLEEPYRDSHIWIATPDEHGLAACGYGLLYEVTLLAIALRNNMNFNSQFLEVFGMPFRTVHTDRVDQVNQDRIEAMMQMMGSLGYGIFGPEDKVEFIDSAKGGGYKAYGDFDKRNHDLISKALLGHSDALDSAGKSPQKQSSTGMSNSPQAVALEGVQAEDGDFLTEMINTKVFDFLRVNGIMIPEGLEYKFTNDAEEQEAEKTRNEQNVLIGQFIQAAAMGNINVVPTEELMTQVGFKLVTAPTPEAAPMSKKKIVNAIHSHKHNNDNNFAGSGHSREEYVKQLEFRQADTKEKRRLDREYMRKTDGMDGSSIGLTKEEYYTYAEKIQEHIDNGTAPDFSPGDSCDVHINCGCYIDDNDVWQTTGDNVCDDCLDLQDNYNSSRETPEE